MDIKKNLSFIIVASLLVACGKKDSSSNQTKAPTLEVKTTFIDSSDIACNYKNKNEGFSINNLNHDIVNGVLQTQFDIIFPQEISQKIITELKSKKQKISAKDFWNILSKENQTILNDYLIENYGTLRDNDFNTKRRITAYAFTIFTEIENYQQAINIKASSSKLFKEFTIAFSYDIREKLELDFCNDNQLEKIATPSDLTVPTDIVSNIRCEDLYGENKVSIQIMKDKNIHIGFKTNKITDHFNIATSALDIFDNDKVKRISFNDSQFDLDFTIYKNKTRNAHYDYILRTYVYDSVKYLNISFKNYGKHSIDLYRLDCKVIKPLNF